MRLATPTAARPGVMAFSQLPDTGADEQRRLALNLIGSVGYDGAVRYCRNNSWDGVLRAILALPRDEEILRRAS
jgi:hypothetical protein